MEECKVLEGMQLGYAKEKDILGTVAIINYIDETYTLLGTNLEGEVEEHVVKMSEVEILPEAGEIGEELVFHKDILTTEDQKLLWEVEVTKDNKVILHPVNNKLERLVVEKAPVEIDKENLSNFTNALYLLGNSYELEVEEEFNMAIVKDFDGKHFTYFYAGHRVAENEVDLIKAVFFGEKQTGEEYERRTLSYGVFLDSLKSGTLTEVSIDEFKNYITGVTYGLGEVEEEPVVEEENEVCEDCKESIESCNCEPW